MNKKDKAKVIEIKNSGNFSSSIVASVTKVSSEINDQRLVVKVVNTTIKTVNHVQSKIPAQISAPRMSHTGSHTRIVLSVNKTHSISNNSTQSSVNFNYNGNIET